MIRNAFMSRVAGSILAVAAAALLSALSTGVAAQSAKSFPCGLGMVRDAAPQAIRPVAYRLADVPAGHVRLNFVGHATFLIQSPQGVKVVTDYNDYYVPQALPDIATMNIQRGNHSRDAVDPSVSHVLRGWDTGDGLPRHHVRFKDVRVYNIPTNIQDIGGTLTNYSSIFVIEAAGICIAHLGHLAHALDKERIAQFGRIDVLLVPVDRRVTQSLEELNHNLTRIAPRLIIPMHFNSMYTVNEFAAEMNGRYPVKRLKTSDLTVARSTLPDKPEIWIMPGGTLFDFGGQQL